MNPLSLALVGPGGETRLSDHLGPNGVVVYFLRDFGCHTCVHHAVELGGAHADIQGQGYEVVVVGHGSASDAAKVRERHKLPFAVLADPKHEAFDAFDLNKVLGYWQKSGAFVLDKSGTRVYGEPSTSPKAGLELNALLAALKPA